MSSSIFWYGLFSVSIIGTISSTVFLFMVLAAVRRSRRVLKEQRTKNAASRVERWPGVTMLKPVHGLEPRMEENLEGYFLLDYPNYELVFGCRSEDDKSLTVVKNLCARYPNVRVRIVFSGEPAWPNAKVYSLDRMIASSSNDYFVISDSDITVSPDFLKTVIPHLLDSKNGLVTCLYRGVPANDFWSGLEALGMSVELPSGVMVADMLEGMRFSLGAAMVFRRDALDAIGGIGTTADYYSDDFVLGNRIFNAGYKIILDNPGIGHVLTAQTFVQTFKTQLRWMQSTRYSRPKGHFGTGLTFSIPFGILALISASAIGHWRIGLALIGWSYLNRVIQSLEVGWSVVRDRRALSLCWVYPLRDLIGFVVWAASYLGGSSFNWRGEIYNFTTGGRIVAASRRTAAAKG